jgi:hypothetical protein
MKASTLLYSLCNLRKWPDARKYLSSDASDEEKKLNVMHRSTNGRTCLHRACFNSAPDHIFKALIDIGGKELVMMRYGSNRTALHWAFCEGASYKSCNAIIKMLIDVGGKDLVMVKDQDGNTALHNLCYYINSHTETANRTKLLLEVGDANVLLSTKNKYEKSPLQIATSKHASDEIKILLIPQTNFSSSKVENNTSSNIAPADNSSDHPIEQSHYRQQITAQNSSVGTNDSNDAVRKLHAQLNEFQKQLKKFQQDYDQKCAECFNLQNTNTVERKEKLRLTRALTEKDLNLQQTNRRHTAAFEQESNKSKRKIKKVEVEIDILQQQKENSESRVDNLIEICLEQKAKIQSMKDAADANAVVGTQIKRENAPRTHIIELAQLNRRNSADSEHEAKIQIAVSAALSDQKDNIEREHKDEVDNLTQKCSKQKAELQRLHESITAVGTKRKHNNGRVHEEDEEDHLTRISQSQSSKRSKVGNAPDTASNTSNANPTNDGDGEMISEQLKQCTKLMQMNTERLEQHTKLMNRYLDTRRELRSAEARIIQLEEQI